LAAALVTQRRLNRGDAAADDHDLLGARTREKQQSRRLGARRLLATRRILGRDHAHRSVDDDAFDVRATSDHHATRRPVPMRSAWKPRSGERAKRGGDLSEADRVEPATGWLSARDCSDV
jgi:hypothetical protein